MNRQQAQMYINQGVECGTIHGVYLARLLEIIPGRRWRGRVRIEKLLSNPSSTPHQPGQIITIAGAYVRLPSNGMQPTPESGQPEQPEQTR